MLSVQQILQKTNYGLNLMSHIVRLGHPAQDGLRVSFSRDYWPNPFDEYRRNLLITYAKERPDDKISDYVARYHDESGHIPDGNAVDLAGHYWDLKGQELLQKINEELHLRLGESFNFYEKPKPAPVEDFPDDLPEDIPAATPDVASPEPVVTTPTWPGFSFFRRPIKNVTPCRTITIPDLYRYVTSDYAAATTAQLRTISDEDAAKAFKGAHFDYCTPGGVFSRRADSALVADSGLMVIDVDDLQSSDEVEAVFRRLLDNRRLETQLLFRSPRGLGIKWFIEVVNNQGHTRKFFFQAVSNYLKTLGIAVDPSGKDISRPCYIPCDRNAFIHPKYL